MNRRIAIIVAFIMCLGMISACGKQTAGTDREILETYISEPAKEYSDEEKTQIVNAYKNLLDTEGEEYVDEFLSREQQNELTLMGMTVNVYVFRDFSNNAYLNADDSFLDISGYNTIAGFDVDAQPGSDGFANLEAVDITIDGKLCTTANLSEEINSFFERFKAANANDKTTTVYGVDTVDVDENTRLYITYLDVKYDDEYNVTALRVSGHLLTR